jgi:hypothetical protein
MVSAEKFWYTYCVGETGTGKVTVALASRTPEDTGIVHCPGVSIFTLDIQTTAERDVTCATIRIPICGVEESVYGMVMVVHCDGTAVLLVRLLNTVPSSDHWT